MFKVKRKAFGDQLQVFRFVFLRDPEVAFVCTIRGAIGVQDRVRWNLESMPASTYFCDPRAFNIEHTTRIFEYILREHERTGELSRQNIVCSVIVRKSDYAELE